MTFQKPILKPKDRQDYKSTDKPKQWIEYLFKNTGTSKRDAENLSRALKKIAGDLYTETERFIFELLQNADDFPNKSEQVKIQFVLLNEHLLILHNGQAFSQKEVEAISSIGDSTKATDCSKTGYKGIGFKSVFTDANCVYIFSNNYQFRYDKNYSEYENPELIPWEIKPIWTDKTDLPEEIQSYSDFFNYPVAISLKVGNSKINEYKTKIKELFSEPRFMLFLRHVKIIEVLGLNQELTINLSLERENNFKKISENGILKSEWLVKDFEFDVPEEVREKIKNDQKVPQKLQEATKTKLSFAAKIEPNKIVKLKPEESVLFTYLPTNVKDFAFPFVVNADFLTTANRQDLHRDNEWNAFIFEQIGYHLFEFLKWINLCEPEYKNYITSLIKPKFSNTFENLKQAFNRGLAKGLQEIAFIPSAESNELLKVSEAIFDQTEITKIIKPETIKSVLGIKEYFVSNSLENITALKQLNVKVFELETLIRFLRGYFDPETYIYIILHIKQKNYIQKIIKEKVPLILDENFNLIASTEDNPVYFQPSEEDKNLLTFDDFSFIHSELAEICQKKLEVKESLESLGVKVFSPVQIIKNRLKNGKYKPNKNTVNDHINHLHFIYKYRHQLTDNEYQKLAQLEILYTRGNDYYSSIASDCYLSDYYHPSYPLESVAEQLGINNFQFIVSNYCNNEREIDNWRDFFLKINVIKPNGLEIITRYILPIIEQGKININNTIKITRFLFSIFCRHSNIISRQEIKTKLGDLLLKTSNGIKPAKDCYLSDFYSFNSQSSNFLPDINLPNLLSQDYCQNNDNPERWGQFFLNIGVKNITGIDIIREKIKVLNDNPDYVTVNNTIEITREIFIYRNQLTADDFDRLSNLNLLLKNGEIAPAFSCYLSNEYQPRQNLESLFFSTDFTNIISEKYIDNNNLEEWKSFFLNIKVAEEIRVYFTKKQSVKFPNNYIQFINKQAIIKPDQSYESENLLVIGSFIHYHNNYQFSSQIWTYLIENWDRLNLGKDATIWIYNREVKVASFFQFMATQFEAIPCTDNKCRKPAEVYSSSLSSYLVNCNLPICSIDFSAKIEEFLGIKRNLDIKACLKLLNTITNNYFSENLIKQVSFIYEQLIKNFNQRLNNDQIKLLNQWTTNGQLLACDEKFYPVSNLYYLSNDVNLPYKRNPNLVYIPDNINQEKIENVFSQLEVNKIDSSQIEIKADLNDKSDDLRDLIAERAYYLSVYLSNSQNDNLVNSQKNRLLNELDNITFINSNQLYLSCQEIDYQEDIYNYFDTTQNTIFYVGKWNSRKNAKIGEYLIQGLKIDDKKITPEKLLDFLEDDLKYVVQYLIDIGFDIAKIPDHTSELSPKTEANLESQSSNYNENTTVSTNIKSAQEGIGNNPEYWGEWGEKIARNWYENNAYQVTKKPDGTGYDFLCQKDNQVIYSEVKTISSHSEVIRITKNEWKIMCQSNNHTKYELFIIVHIGESVTQTIRIKSLWITLQEIFSKLSEYNLTSINYASKQIEVLMGFQGNSNNSSNDIIFNWKRIAEEGTFLSSNIEIIPFITTQEPYLGENYQIDDDYYRSFEFNNSDQEDYVNPNNYEDNYRDYDEDDYDEADYYYDDDIQEWVYFDCPESNIPD